MSSANSLPGIDGGVRIRIASTAAELRDLFRVRHDVLVGGGYMTGNTHGMIVDAYDAFPSVTNLIATVDETVIGGARLEAPSPCGVSADDLYDFSGLIAAPETTGGGSRGCVLPQYRRAGIYRTLFKMLHYLAVLQNMTHLRGSANPEVVPLMQALGWRTVGDPVVAEGLDVVPMLLDLSSADMSLTGFTDHQELNGFEDTFERVFFAADERVVRAGSVGNEAYLVMEGEAVAFLPGGTRRLGAGDVFGELAVLTDSRRTVNIDAITDLELMSLRRDELEKQLVARPEQALRLLRMLLSRYRADITTAAG
jgi:N-acyl amino acid synthase FeeM/cyclic nucleotide-binding protein